MMSRELETKETIRVTCTVCWKVHCGEQHFVLCLTKNLLLVFSEVNRYCVKQKTKFFHC